MTRRIPATVVQLGTVLDLTTQEGDRRTTWQGVDVGGLLMCADPRAMEHGPGRAALYLLRAPRTPNSARRNAGPKSGYTDCACRDCFDVAIGKAGEALCSDCEAAGCEANNGECQRPDAYGVEDDSRSDNARARKNAVANLPPPKLRADRVHVDRQGYANRGRDYFGAGGLPLYRVYMADGSTEFDEYIRAPSAAEAKAHARATIAKQRARTGNPQHGGAAADTYERWHRRAPGEVCELDKLPDDLPHYIGRALRIGYRSDKWHGRGDAEDYDHDYTEPGYSPPGVWADDPDLAKATAIVIRGGNQRITPGGID
jgi:hypothetical protein